MTTRPALRSTRGRAKCNRYGRDLFPRQGPKLSTGQIQARRSKGQHKLAQTRNRLRASRTGVLRRRLPPEHGILQALARSGLRAAFPLADSHATRRPPPDTDRSWAPSPRKTALARAAAPGNVFYWLEFWHTPIAGRSTEF